MQTSSHNNFYYSIFFPIDTDAHNNISYSPTDNKDI